MFRSETIIELGIIFLLIYTPLALGGRDEASVALLELVSGVLLIVWLAKIFSQRKRPSRRRRGKAKNREKGRRKMYRLRIITPPFTWAICLFCALILLQLLPLPGSLINVLSPNTYRLYAEGASNTASALPNWLPLSVWAYATETEFYKFLAYATLFFVMVNTIQSPEQIKRLVYIIIAVGFFEAIYGFRQLSEGRISGTFVNKNHFAGYLEMVIPLAFGVLFARLEERGASPLKKFIHLFEEKYLKAFLLLFVLFVMIAAHLLTGSRGGIISFSLGILFLCLLAYTRRLFRKWVIVVLIFVLLALGTAVMTSPEMILERLGALTKPETELSFQYRWEVWKSTILIFRDFPIIGSGLGTFSHIFRRYQRFPSNLFFTHTENDYLQLLTETGIVGTLLMIGIGFAFFYCTLKAWKRQRSRWAIAIGAGGLSAMFSLCVHSCVDFNLHLPSNALLFSVVAALSYSAAHAQKREGEKVRGSEEQKGEDSRQSAVGSRQSAVGSRQSAVSSQQSVSSIQYRAFNLRGSVYYSVIIVAFVLVLIYLFGITKSLYAFFCYQQFRDTVALIEGGYISPEASPDQSDSVTRYAKNAIRYDRNNAEYYYALGGYLYGYHADLQDAEKRDLQKQGFHEAEEWMQKAVLRDPANPWYYYDLGRLSISRGDCEAQDGLHSNHQSSIINLLSCPTAQYFLAALNNAPNKIFLRREIGLWFYHYDQEMAFRMMREIIARTAGKPLDDQEMTYEITKFLYDMHLDYESDREYLKVQGTTGGTDSLGECHPLKMIPNAQEIEFGNDDGSAEWRTYLLSEIVRVKKVICLPDDFDKYSSAALKILMNNGGNGNFVARIAIDEHVIRQYDPTDPVPRTATWYEIPFDINILQKKSMINVYIRVSGTSEKSNFLQIWGDQHTPTTHSVLNLDTIDDLSFHEGDQTGEYMIRLVLKKVINP